MLDRDCFQLRQPAVTHQLGSEAGALTHRHLGIGRGNEPTRRQAQDRIPKKFELLVMGMQSAGGVGEGFISWASASFANGDVAGRS